MAYGRWAQNAKGEMGNVFPTTQWPKLKAFIGVQSAQVFNYKTFRCDDNPNQILKIHEVFQTK